LVDEVWKEGKAVHEAARALLAHHRIAQLPITDTLTPRLDELRKLVGMPTSGELEAGRRGNNQGSAS
jgi:hypothetical protein